MPTKLRTRTRKTPKPPKKVKKLVTLDVVSETLLNVSIYFLLYRLLTIFIITNYNNFQWELRTDFTIIPILAFRIEEVQFEQMNANSQIITSGLILLGLIFAIIRSPRREKTLWNKHIRHIGKMIGWYMGVIMTLIMFYFSLYLNDALRFEVADYTGTIILMVNVLAALIFIGSYIIVDSHEKGLLDEEKKLNKKKATLTQKRLKKKSKSTA